MKINFLLRFILKFEFAVFKICAGKKSKRQFFSVYFPLKILTKIFLYAEKLQALSSEVTEGPIPLERGISVAVQTVLTCKEGIFFACCIITTVKQCAVMVTSVLAMLMEVLCMLSTCILSAGCTEIWHLCQFSSMKR